MSRARSFRAVVAPPVLGLCLSLVLGACATAPPPRAPPPPDTVEPLVQAGRKVENAVAATKLMIERSRSADYLPDLYMRLAELYTEQARYAWLAMFEKKRLKGDEGRAIDAPAARLLKNLAISVYERLLREFPKYEKGDEALFLMAHEYRELGDFDAMKSTYEKLISQHPKSPHRLEASLILGDAAFDAGDLDRAERNYNAVLAAPESHVHALARYKLGWVRVNKEDCKGAVALFEKILRDRSTPRGEKSVIATQRSLNIHREALVDLAYCYPDVYAEKPAAPFLRSLADTSSDYMAAMRRVAKRFAIKQMYPQAASALREVLGAAVADEEALEDARKLYDNLIKGKVYDQAAVDVERIGQVYEHRYYDYRLAAKERESLAAEFEAYARDIATRAGVLAKERKLPAQSAIAAAAYGAYLDYFSSASARLEIEQNRAEALYDAEEPLAAARAYERIAGLLTDAEPKKQARVNAVAAYQQALEKKNLSWLERLAAWGGIRSQGRALLAENAPDDSTMRLKLSIARSYYDAGEYLPAAELFYAASRQYAATAEGVVAAHLALDALRLADNYERLATLGRRMLADKQLGDDAFKKEVADIIARTEQRQVAELTIASSGDKEERLLSYAKRWKGSGLGEQALYNALLVARTNGDADRFYALGEEFIAQYPKSSLRIDVMTALASVASDRGDFTQASAYLEATYAADPKNKDAVGRLYAAASIHSVLGEAKIVDDLKELKSRGAPAKDIDELLLQTARAGNLTAVQEVLSSANLTGSVAEFLRGYFALERGDKEEAARRLSAVAGASDAAEVAAKARFLMGEMVYEAFLAGGTGELENALTEKSQLLLATDGAYAQAIQGQKASWALAAMGRVSSAYGRFAGFLRALKLPDELSAADHEALIQALGAKADEAEKRAAELKATCAARAREHLVFSDAVRGCLTDEAFPDKIAVLPPLSQRRAADPPGASELRLALLKNPKSIDSLLRLAELYLGTGDLGMSLLVLDRAETVDPRSSAVHNLRGVALARGDQPDAAFQELRRAVELDGKDVQARLNLAAHYAFYGYLPEAKSELKRAGGSYQVRGGVAEHPQLSALSKAVSAGDKK